MSLSRWKFYARTVTDIVKYSTLPEKEKVKLAKLAHNIVVSNEKCDSILPLSNLIVFHKSSVCTSKNDVELEPKILTYSDFTEKLYSPNEPNLPEKLSKVFLGIHQLKNENVPLFGVQLYPTHDSSRAVEERFDGHFKKIDLSLYLESKKNSQLIVKAKANFNWQRNNKYCSSCGNIMMVKSAGVKIFCSECGNTRYCQSTPTVNILVVDEKNENILLVRTSQFPLHLYSLIAGYVDYGENAEEAVEREVMEELGLCVKNIKYVASSHWMLGSNPLLLLGYIANTSNLQTFDVNSEEIEDSVWLSRQEIKLYYEDKGVFEKKSVKYLPPSGTLAHTLISQWANQAT